MVFYCEFLTKGLFFRKMAYFLLNIFFANLIFQLHVPSEKHAYSFRLYVPHLPTGQDAMFPAAFDLVFASAIRCCFVQPFALVVV